MLREVESKKLSVENQEVQGETVQDLTEIPLRET